MNFNFNEIEEKESGNYIQHGVNKIKVKEIELKELSGKNYSGDAWDISFGDETGATSSVRVFPFKYNPQFTSKDKSGKQIVQTEADQWKAYQAKIKHLFTKSLGEENFEKAVKTSKDLRSLFRNLQQGCIKVGKEFAAMFISDKKGYAKFPMWENGCAAHLENIEKLQAVYAKNSAKYGPQTAPKDTEVPVSSSNLDDLFSQINTPAPQVVVEAFSPTEEEEDLFPF